MSGLDQFKQTYITECFELLVDMEERLLALDTTCADREALNAIFRCAHSIKGGAGAFGFDFITHFTHVLEALLDAMREERIPVSRAAVDLLLKAADVVTQMIEAARDGTRPPEGLGDTIRQQLEALASGQAVADMAAAPTTSHPVAAAEEKHTWRIDFAPHESLFASGNEPLLILRELSRLGEAAIQANLGQVPPLQELVPTHCYLRWTIQLTTEKNEAVIRDVFEFVSDHCDLTLAPQQPSAPTAKLDAGQPPASPDDGHARTTQTTSIRVDLEKVDRLVNMVGELVITEAMLHAQTRELPPERFAGLLRGIDELSQHTRELQEAVMAVRMQPVKSIFSRMPRIVRDIAAQLGKDIHLLSEGEQTEVDKTVIEQLADPLMHMIRNSCDHGIELPEVRTQLGKPAQGTIHLRAHHRGGRIIIDIRDDGAGINRARVLAKAREKNLITTDTDPSPEEIDQLVFLPGFSTAEQVTNVSGRGVGMDVVKRNIEHMGGTVSVVNQPGLGTHFSVSLPLTLAILDGMIVRVGAERYIVPITSIIETLRPRADAVHAVEGHHDVINVRGEFVPLIYLYRLFDVADAIDDPSRALTVLVEAGQKKIGLVVDELIGQQQVVIKSLDTNAERVRGISGATILGDGQVSLILEINDLQPNASPPPVRIAA